MVNLASERRWRLEVRVWIDEGIQVMEQSEWEIGYAKALCG